MNTFRAASDAQHAGCVPTSVASLILLIFPLVLDVMSSSDNGVQLYASAREKQHVEDCASAHLQHPWGLGDNVFFMSPDRSLTLLELLAMQQLPQCWALEAMGCWRLQFCHNTFAVQTAPAQAESGCILRLECAQTCCCADIYALLKALQSIENAFTRGRIEPDAYEEMCKNLLTQWEYAYSGDVKTQVPCSRSLGVF